ncbi:small integral membrane protein 32-like [Astyanax mexicanus]|uniref:small integral membrane protein 32-like n=1 Tax=Astyanax mexicanus TaxID=7994 RepID=UPI0020CB3185|nr:small integral membrane protein 32-like [Astyanax mexicanus]
MLRQVLLNSTAAARGLDAMSHTHAPPPLNVSLHAPVSVSALLKPSGRGGGAGGGGAGGLREGEYSKPDLATYVVMCLVLFLLVLLIVLFINCQLRNSFFASMPYDRSLREARSSYK